MSPRALLLAAAVSLGWAAPPAPSSGLIARDPGATLPPALRQVVDGLRVEPLARHIAYLADPQRQGRGLGSPGLLASAGYVTGELRQMGLAPLGRSYEQAVPLRRVTGLGGGLRLAWGAPGSRRGLRWRHGQTCLLPELEPQILKAPLVFAGYGIREQALGHDDFQGLQVRGKIVLLIGGLPPGPAWQSPELRAKYGGVKPQDRYEARMELLDRLGAKAVLALEPGLDAQGAAGLAPQEPFYRPAAGAAGTGEPPLARLSLGVAAPLLAAMGVDLQRPESVRPQVLPQAFAELCPTGRVRRENSRNLLAVLPGSDPSLAGQAVLLGAHLDHLGMAGGVVHPGADDNASGVAALLEIARGFTALPTRPRRTVIFAFWTGEEDGKFGSGHYVRHPRWPLRRTAAYLNLDMIGHPWTGPELRKLVLEADPGQGEGFLAGLDPADFVEPGFAASAPQLGQVLAEAGRGTGLALHLDPTDGRNGGSDYRDFARVGVPWIRFFGNFFPAYHEPGDTAANLDPAQVQRMARLALATAWLLAEAQ